MAFNQGPEPRIVLNENGVRYIDPNPTDQIVNHEDLIMYVKLIARTKGRSILTQTGSQVALDMERKFTRNTTNFTYNDDKNYLDTEWTNLGGGPQDPGEDIGTFGITNINIEFKSSFMPKIVIDFVDIRGATLFEQGPCSPYSAFLHLPYPVFELTVKGYYGKPVTYTLALVKFNTKFNSETGNFESKAEFVGYTYAFLSDIPMGYIMAVPYMKNHAGSDTLKRIWDNYRSIPGLSDTTDGLPLNPKTIFDLIRDAKKLETKTPELKNSIQVVDLGKLGKVKNSMTSLKTLVEDIQKVWIDKCGGRSKKCTIRKSGNTGKRNVPIVVYNQGDPNPTIVAELYSGIPGGTDVGVIEPYLGDGTEESWKASKVGIKYGVVKEQYNTVNVEGGPPELTFENIKSNIFGFWGVAPKNDNNLGGDVYGIDLYEALLKEINIKLEKIETAFDTKKEKVKKQLNDAVRATLGFHPSIRNVFAIILANTEAFLEVLRDTSVKAEEHHDDNKDNILNDLNGSTGNILSNKDTVAGGNGPQMSNQSIVDDNNAKIYPWPTYYQTKTAPKEEVGEKETYPGENIFFSDWPEVKFVEDFVIALTKLREDLELLEGEINDKPGFDNFAPLGVLDTPILGNENAACRWFSVGRGSSSLNNVPNSAGLSGEESLWATIGENAFLVGDYSFINTLSLWKSQLGFYNTFGFDFESNGTSTSNGATAGGAALEIGPQSIIDNPIVIANISNNNNLNRYGENGFNWNDSDPKAGVTSFTKISPTTKTIMNNMGRVDALNCMSTLYGEEDSELLQILKANKGSSVDELKLKIKNQVKEAIKKKWGDNYKEQDFANWAISATAAINNGTPKAEVITEQTALYSGPFTYVKSGKILTLTGPIPVSNNDVVHSQAEKDSYLSANPYNNPREGAALMSKTEIEGTRDVNMVEGTLPSKLVEQFTAHWDQKPSSTESTASGADALSPNSIMKNLLAYGNSTKRPLWYSGLKDKCTASALGTSNCASVSPYVSAKYEQKNRLISHPHTNLPYKAKSQNSYNLYYQSQKSFNSTVWEVGEKILWDLGSSRSLYTKDSSTTSYADFVGPTNATQGGAADAFVQTPLWTCNYPLQKMPILGTRNQIMRQELILNNTNPSWEEKWDADANNYSRNNATWWGVNSWGTATNSDGTPRRDTGWSEENWALPLMYLLVMSLGFDLLGKPHHKLGHFCPNDGDLFYRPSSFSTFTHYGIFDIPRSYALLIGAILWRAKEGYALMWDDIKPTLPSDYKGWNRANKCVGIDDLSDPVWFFHNCISRPWYLGGAVFDTSGAGGSNAGNYGNYNYRRKYFGKGPNKIDLWSHSGGDSGSAVIADIDAISAGMGGNAGWKRLIGAPSFATGYIQVNSFYWSQNGNTNGLSNKGSAWLKTHQNNGSGWNDTTTPLNIRRGFFDNCRQDQIPFVFNNISKVDIPSDTQPSAYYEPKTLVFTELYDQNKEANSASAPAGAPESAPNRHKNAYLRLKEECKELMLLPKSLKEDFIKYFVDFSLSHYKATSSNKMKGASGDDNSYGLFKLYDPINFENSYGLGDSDYNYYRLRKEGAWDVLPPGSSNPSFGNKSFGFPAELRGFYGYLSDASTDKIWGADGGYWNDDNFNKNPWFAIYGTSTNWAKLQSNTSSTSNNASSGNVQYATQGGVSCFVSGSKILLSNGKQKNIEDVNKEDNILTYNVLKSVFETSNIGSISLDYKDEIIKIYLENGITITSTNTHPYFIKNKGWSVYSGAGDFGEEIGVRKQMSVGDEVYYYDSNKNEFIFIKIDKILEKPKSPTKVWNLKNVTNNHNFIINNVLVHNVT